MTQQEQARLDRLRKADRFRELNKVTPLGKIVCTGSSLMEMFPIEKLVKEHGYPIEIYNRGIGGYMINDLFNNIDVCILELKPSRLFINIGTNDLSWSTITINQIITSYEQLLKTVLISLPDIEIYIMAYFPVNYEAASEEMRPCLRIRNNERINEANIELQKMANRLGAKYIDVNSKMKDEQGRLKAEYTIEGMHIKEEGYRAIFDDFMNYVNEPSWK